ncbi:hypothetical protein D3C84_1004850 [compost metagenome]
MYEHLFAPVAVEAVEHVLHLLAGREQHQRTARAFDQIRQITDDRGGVRGRVTGIGVEVGHPQHTGVSVMERARHYGGDSFFRQPGAHAEAVEGAEGRQCRGGHQRAVGHVPQVASQHLCREDRAGVDLDVE